MSQVRVLILDEDEEMCALIAQQIRSSEFEVEWATSFPNALSKLEQVTLEQNPFSLFIMDSKIPEHATLEVLKQVRDRCPAKHLAILILVPVFSEKDQESWRVAGADGFLGKPFDRASLLAHVNSLVRKVVPLRERVSDKPNQITLGALTLDLKSYDVFNEGMRLHLTPNEFKLLQALLSHAGEILSREQLIELVQGYGIAVIDRAVDTHIFSLRKKLGTFGDSIETVRGSGYRISRELV